MQTANSTDPPAVATEVPNIMKPPKNVYLMEEILCWILWAVAWWMTVDNSVEDRVKGQVGNVLGDKIIIFKVGQKIGCRLLNLL